MHFYTTRPDKKVYYPNLQTEWLETLFFWKTLEISDVTFWYGTIYHHT